MFFSKANVCVYFCVCFWFFVCVFLKMCVFFFSRVCYFLNTQEKHMGRVKFVFFSDFDEFSCRNDMKLILSQACGVTPQIRGQSASFQCFKTTRKHAEFFNAMFPHGKTCIFISIWLIRTTKINQMCWNHAENMQKSIWKTSHRIRSVCEYKACQEL